MANTYFPMLPPVNEDVSKILKDQAGIWKETDINFLRGLANSLDCGESIREMGSVDSIPDMWARPLLFKMALFDLDPTRQFITGLHEKVRGEWRALLAMFALKEIRRLDLRAEQVNLLEDNSDLAQILKSLAPKDSLTGNNDAWLTDIYIITLNGLPIAITSPITLISCVADYESTFEGKLFAPWSSNHKYLTDPIKFLPSNELSALKLWLSTLYDNIQRIRTSNSVSKQISNALLKCIADYQSDIDSQHHSNVSCDFVPSNLNLHVGTARFLDFTVKSREPRFEDSAVRLINNKTNILLIEPAFVRNFANFQGVEPSKLVIWQGVTANDIFDENLVVRRKIGNITLNNAEHRRPDDFFYDRIAVVEPNNAFPNSPVIQGANSLSDKDLTPILPIKRDLLEIFSPQEILSRISISDDDENFYLHFNFPLSGISGNGIDFRWSKTYPKHEIIYIDQEVPVIELYPDFQRSDWHSYFLFYENYQSDAQNLASDVYFVTPFNFKSQINTLTNRFTLKLDSYPEILIVTYNPPPHSGKSPYDVGVIFLNQPKTIERNADLTWNVGIDFGTSSTMIFYAENHNSPLPLNFQPHLLQITNSGGARTQTYRHFIPSNLLPNADGSFLSIFHVLNDAETIRPLIDGHIFMLSSENTRVFEQYAAFIDANLKWNDDSRQRRKTAAYIQQICLQIAVEANFNGVTHIQWNFSYPTAFSNAQTTSFQEICRASVNNTPNFYSESKAAAYHFNKLNNKVANFAQGAICVDIGAGTTDISVISGEPPRIVYHTSIRYAARHMFKPIYDNYSLFAGETLSNRLNDENKRLAVIDADLRAHSDTYLADLKFKTGREPIKNVLQAVQFATAGLFHYLGTLIKVLHDYGHYKEKKIPHLFIGGNGARIFHWLTGGTDIEGNIYLKVLENIFVSASELKNYKRFNLNLSPQPKIEVAAGMIVDKPANDVDFFDEERINREMFGDADEIIYSAVLAGAEFVQSGENQSGSAFISAHDISEGISIATLKEFRNFVTRFNKSSKLWAEGIDFDDEELIRDTNNYFMDKRGRDVKNLAVEPVFIAELKLIHGLSVESTVKSSIEVENATPNDKIAVGAAFVNDFNALSKLSGFSGRQTREKFIRRHKIIAFACSNVDERMNRPKIAPKFVETSSIASGDYWASAIEGNLYAVVPNLKTYTENHHAERGFGLVFESNYEVGTYTRIKVENAAIFEHTNGKWTLKQRGKLHLNS